jgi:hypothetical protein
VRAREAEAQELLDLLGALEARAAAGYGGEAINLLYHAREGWIVLGVGVLRTDAVDELCVAQGAVPRPTLLEALRDAFTTLTGVGAER